MEKEYFPLVSIVVITYNSASTVLETLDSIKKQTYHNLELIISDDCSTDNTRHVVKKWLEDNKNKLPFRNAILISTEKNGGPAINCNCGIKESKGEWIKIIAADDILLPDCINKNIEYVKIHNDTQILISRMECFKGCNEIVLTQDDVNWNFWKLTYRQQYHLILLDNWITAPSQFVKKDIWERLNGFDESIPFIEDWPFWIKAYKAGVKFGFLDELTVRYRFHESLSRSSSLSPRFLESLNLANKYAHRCQFHVCPLFRFYSFVRDNLKHKVIKKMLFVLNPYYWYVRYVNSLIRL